MMVKNINFKIIKKSKKGNARVGEIHTPHGIVQTPTFTPVGTQATVKSLSPDDLQKAGAQLIFGNTYHLHLRPGEDTIKDFGGLGKFMSWDGSTITDSGGFQVFSLGRGITQNFTLNHTEDVGVDPRTVPLSSAPNLVKITQDGVKFRSHLDGSQHMFTPEVSIQIQKKLGADLILAFDECAPHPSTKEYTREAMERTHDWALRSLHCFNDLNHQSKQITSYSSSAALAESRSIVLSQPKGSRQARTIKPFKQGLYGIAQGGVYEDLRTESAKFIGTLDTFGIAIGGVSVGESKQEMRNALAWTTPFLPEEKPKHLLGIGEVDDIFAAVEYGMDTFDCVIPTRFGRYGIVFVSPAEGGTPQNKFRLDLAKTIYAKDQRPMTNGCDCYVCKTFKRGYIHHLLKANEMLGYRLASYHNVYFLLNLSRKIREALLNDQFQKLKEEWIG